MVNNNEKSGLSQGQNTAKAAETGGDRVNEFFQKNRKGILVTILIIVIMLIGLIVFLSVRDNMEKKAIAEVERLIEEYKKLNIDDEHYADDLNDLLARLEAFAGTKKGFAASRAWSISAGIYSGREEWASAEEAWLKSAEAGTKTYLGPIAYFQAAIAAEEQNKPELAIDYLRQCTSHSFEFTDAPRAQFNIGRLYEQLGEKTLAIEAYRAVLLNYQWENDSFNQVNFIWHNLARNRIIVLEM